MLRWCSQTVSATLNSCVFSDARHQPSARSSRTIFSSISIGERSRARSKLAVAQDAFSERDFRREIRSGLEFPARAGHLYVIEMQRRPGFDRFLRTSPIFEIGVNSAMPSIGLAWGRQFDGTVVWCLGILSVMLLGWAIVSHRRSLQAS